MTRHLALLIILLAFARTVQAETTRFCLEGEFDLGGRYQGLAPKVGEFYPLSWCVVTESSSERVRFTGRGQSNPDLYSDWTVAYLPPETVRIVNRETPPDLEFVGADHSGEARRVRRLDPHRLLSEYLEHRERFDGIEVLHANGRLQHVRATTDLPLRGRVPLSWHWDWSDPDAPRARLLVDDTLMFRGKGRWETLEPGQAAETWARTPGADPIEIPGENWPARVAMERVELAAGVHLVRGVRTGFQHLVVETSEGLVIGDAPAGWVEFHQVPPADLVPGLGVSGLSERFVDFLEHEFPDQSIAAVALTHMHDDHAGGARAFAAAGARVYAPAGIEAFLERALNRPNMPPDRLSKSRSSIDIVPVQDSVTIGDEKGQARLVSLGPGPHVNDLLGLLAVGPGYFFVSDVHVPRSDSATPRAERAATECGFARKAVALLPESVLVVNSHSSVMTPVSRLQQYLYSEACRALEENGGSD